MDPIITSIVVVLGKYALDKGVELSKEVGPKALETAKEMFTTVLDRLRKDPTGKVVADQYEKNPQVYEKPVEQQLDAAVQADPEFAAQLQSLLEQFEQAAKEHAVATGTVYKATVKGSGAVAVDHGVAAGKGGVAVGRDVHGGVHISGSQEEDE